MLSFECRPGSLPLSLEDNVKDLPPLGGGDTIRGGGEDGVAPSCGDVGKLTVSRVVARTGELDIGDCVSGGIDDVREETVPNALTV